MSEIPDTSNWPLLLKNYTQLNTKAGNFTALPDGYSPLKRPLNEHLKYGVINLDKPANPSSHEIVSWVKQILKVEKTGHSGTLDPKVTGVLIICLNRATRIAKSQQNAGKEYVAVLKLHDTVPTQELESAVKFLTGRVYQCPPLVSAVKKELRVRHIYSNQIVEYDPEQKLAILKVACEAGTYIRVLCEHIGLVCKVGGEMAELRRTRTGNITEENGLVTMYDVLDSKWLLDKRNDESYIRRVVRPLEWMLTEYKRIVIKDTCVDAICHGAKAMIPGIIRYDPNIETGDTIILISTKGEAIALAIAQMPSNLIMSLEHGVVANIKRVIMDRGTYPKKWGLGPVAMERKRMIKEGLLTDKGKPNNKTPPNWMRNFLEGKLKNQ
ncbi:H/ACA ribonucleoprotein complex subunit 4 [Histomonas meleagridis]|uniref:H/ACA ribonucleoprotein complex subunit 4 n=1 Tax=Histomonas meleagridis TaxID=135588 RepID=UPI003559E324|nr:H/ACA ribonucleoprotein complex subunit 4 [Histomonas meleagridis]KAH0797556.1 H/ACA ribonucleoprotein complex subunit 4 [Histomonas meleagridis]